MPKGHPTNLKEAIADVLRAAHGPLGSREISERLPPELGGRSPAQISMAVSQHPLCLATQRGQYVYVPDALTGAAVFLRSLPDTGRHPGRLPPEAYQLLWPEALRYGMRQTPSSSADVELPDGRHQSWNPDWFASHADMLWSDEDASPTAGGFLLRCLDGRGKRFRLEPFPAPSPAQARARAARWLAAAAGLLRARHVYPAHDLAVRLLCGGAYHGEVPHETLADLTGRPPFVQGFSVTYRPDLTPELWRLFAARCRPHAPAHEDSDPPLPPAVARDMLYRLAIKLHHGDWQADFEVAAEHSLEELHVALQTALDWDDDHLYAFYLGGRPYDRLTAVGCPLLEEAPPTTAEVTFGHFDPAPHSHFAYVFDFGDDWRFAIEVTDRREAAIRPHGPLCTATRGDPPQQYPNSSW